MSFNVVVKTSYKIGETIPGTVDKSPVRVRFTAPDAVCIDDVPHEIMSIVGERGTTTIMVRHNKMTLARYLT